MRTRCPARTCAIFARACSAVSPRDGQRRGLHVVDGGRLGGDGGPGNGHVFGVTAVRRRRPPEHLVADDELAHVVPALGHDAAELVSQGKGRVAEPPHVVGADLPVRRTEAGGFHLYQDLARRGTRPGGLGDFQHVGTAEGALNDCSHGSFFDRMREDTEVDRAKQARKTCEAERHSAHDEFTRDVTKGADL